jgi:hypothetical protein
MRLTIKKTDVIEDWYLIERAEHDGREWIEETGPHSSALRCSARFSDADVEGRSREMLAIAAAIEARGEAVFGRCAVDATGETVRFWSPRNSREDGLVTREEADDLARQVRTLLEPTKETA